MVARLKHSKLCVFLFFALGTLYLIQKLVSGLCYFKSGHVSGHCVALCYCFQVLLLFYIFFYFYTFSSVLLFLFLSRHSCM